ncbi:50S ribosomal protein L18e [Candidatus Woesearchaeota archaeon]|nr:50S ribosomal protein L18e [Candidatus Woesearchaeota archaeon]
MRKSYSPNEELQSLISVLREVSSKEKVNIWKRVASDLSRPTRQRRIVNLSRINRVTKENDIVIVPGKVLSAGDIDHKVQVAAFTFSKTAADKIAEAKGTVISIPELLKSNPKGKGIKIVG